MSTLTIRLSLVVAALGAALSAHAAFVDDYSLAQTGTANTTAAGTTNDAGVALNAFTTRTLSLRNLTNTVPTIARSRIGISGGSLNISNDVEVNSLAQVVYVFSTPQSLVGLSAVRFDFLSNDVAGSVHVDTDDGVNHNSQSIPTPASLAPFSVTVANIFGAVNPAAVRTVVLSFDYSAPGGDSVVTNIQAVPEPSALAVLALPVIGLQRRRKRA